MTAPQIASEIRQFVARESNIGDEHAIGMDVDLFTEGIMDSLMVVSLIAFCEERFGCTLSGEDFFERDMRTIDGLTTAISGQIAC